MNPYYQPSHKTPVAGILLLLAGGVATAALLALMYIYAVWYIPFVYINCLLCLGFGLVLGVALALLVRLGKLRSPVAVGGLALLLGAAAVYLEWGVFLTLLLNTQETAAGTEGGTSFSAPVLAGFLTHPAVMWEAMRQVNTTGTWSLKGSTPSGVFLWVIWVIEAAIILAGAYWLAHGQATEPFSETSNEWADDELLPQPVGYIQDAAATRMALETGRFQQLAPHLDAAALAPFARLKMHSAPNDPNCRYLTLQNVKPTVDKKGKTSQTVDTIVKYLAISPATYHELYRRFGTLLTSTAAPAAGQQMSPETTGE